MVESKTLVKVVTLAMIGALAIATPQIKVEASELSDAKAKITDLEKQMKR